jgi:hypothetical protein
LGGTIAVAACSDTSMPTQPLGSQTARAGGSPALVSAQHEVPAHIHLMPMRAVAVGLDNGANPHGGGGGGGSNTGIFYHGGPIIQFQSVVAVYWAAGTIYNGGPTPGTSGAGSVDGSLIGFFLRSLGASPYFNINTTYFNGSGTHVANSVTYTGFWADNTNVPSAGSSVSDVAVQAEVTKGLNSGALTFDPSTLFAVFSGPGVNLGGGFGTQYCAYHGHFSWNGNDVKYAVMPHDYDFPSACAALSGSPNIDFAADAEVNTLAHETEETTTDEDLNAWYDRRGMENADKCAWTFGTTYRTTNGATANMNLGGKDFLIQRNWVNAGSGGCAKSYP